MDDFGGDVMGRKDEYGLWYVFTYIVHRLMKNQSSELGETGQPLFLQMFDSRPESIHKCLKKLLPVARDSGLELILTKKNQNPRKNRFLTRCGTDPELVLYCTIVHQSTNSNVTKM
jgi:hypothetical protein